MGRKQRERERERYGICRERERERERQRDRETERERAEEEQIHCQHDFLSFPRLSPGRSATAEATCLLPKASSPFLSALMVF